MIDREPAVPAFEEDDVQVVVFHAEPSHLINANDRSKGWRRRKQTLTRYWRTVAGQVAGNQIRKGQLRRVERAHIEITVTWPDRNRRDVNNWQPTAKPIVDGLVKAGLLPDDDDTHVTGPDMRRGYYATPPAIPRITIAVAIRETP